MHFWSIVKLHGDSLYCAHGGDKTASHDVIHDVFASIVRDVGFHVWRKQTHILPSPSFSIHLANVVIANPTQTNLVSHQTFSCGVVMTLVAQVKERLYCDCCLTNLFFPLAIEVFGCFQEHVDNFLHVLTWCGQERAPKAPPLFVLH